MIGVFDGRRLTDAAQAVDRASRGRLSAILKRGDLPGRLGSTLLLHEVPGTAAQRVLLVGLGKAEEFGAKNYREAVRAAEDVRDGLPTRAMLALRR